MAAPTLHDLLVDLLRRTPELSAEGIATLASLKLPHFDEVSLVTEATEPTRQSVLRADAVFVLRRNGKNVLAIVVEVQNRLDRNKPEVWLTYLGSTRRMLGCPVLLVVVTSSPAVARWAAKGATFGHPGLSLAPIVIGPLTASRIACEADARARPFAALLGAIAHARAPDAAELVPVALAAIDALDGALADPEGELRTMVVDILMELFEQSARGALEVLMERKYEVRSVTLRKMLRDSEAKGRVEGEARGRIETQIESVLDVLEARGLDVPEWVADRLRACGDSAELGQLVRRAAVVASADALFLAS